jgi:hypothetical protein
MANKLIFNNCLSKTTANKMYSGCCCLVECIVANTNTKSVTINSIFGFFGGTFDFDLVSVNGTTPSFPLTVAASGTFTLEFEICAGSGTPTDTLSIVINETGGSETTTFPFSLSNVSSITPTSNIDFGLVPSGTTSAPQTITIFNDQTVCDAIFVFDSNNCGGGFVAIPSSVTLAPNGSTTIDVTWTPPSSNLDINCQFRIEVCGVFDEIRVTAESEPADCECLCCTGINIDTESRLIPTVNLNCDEPAVFKKSAIGEQKEVVFNFTYTSGIADGFEVFFNPVIFGVNCNFSSFYGGPINSAPPSGYYIEFFTSMIGGGWFEMALFNSGVNTPNQKNWKVEMYALTSTQFKIRLTFFLISDLQNWISAAVFNNAPKWRRNHVFAPVPPLIGPFTNSFPSVYNSNRRLCSLFWIHDPNRIVEETGNDFECYNTHSINWTSRFFNKGLYDGPSEFLDPLFTFERNGNPVTNLSTIQKTEVKFFINIPSTFGLIEGVIFNLFDESTTDNTVDFLANYNNSRSRILNNPATTVLDNLLESPSSIVALGGDDYEITAFIGTGLNLSHQYRIFAVVYSANEIVNSFISEPLRVTNIPTADCNNCQTEVYSIFQQVFRQEESECLRPVAKERIRHLTFWNWGSLGRCFPEVTELNFLDYVNSITLNVYRRELDFPIAGKTTFFMFEQHTSSRVVGFPSNWNNFGNLIVSDQYPQFRTEFTRRVGWEQTPFNGSNVFVADTATYMNRTPAGPLGAPYVTTLGITNDWRNQQIIYEYVLRMDFSSIFGTPYEINYVQAFQVLAIENEPSNSGYQSIIQNVVFEGFQGGSWIELTGPFCPDNYTLIRATYTANSAGNFAFFAEPFPNGNTATIRESEDAAFLLPQELNVLSLDLTYSPNGIDYVASAILDPSTLTGNSYLLCGYWSEIFE